MTKKTKFIFITIFLTLLVNTNCKGYEAKKIELLLDENYFLKVKQLISSATKSVRVMMFEASYYRKYPDSPSNQLIDALSDASRRGLKVEVILDIKNEIDRTTSRNLDTGKILKKAGVEVVFDPKNITTHTKLLIIDESIVVLGSTNWTYNALTKNHEVSTVIHSAETAQKLMEYFQAVKDAGGKL